MLLNDKPHPNHILTTNTNPNPVPDNTKSLSNQPHTADDALVILATKTALSETQKIYYAKASPSFQNQKI